MKEKPSKAEVSPNFWPVVSVRPPSARLWANRSKTAKNWCRVKCLSPNHFSLFGILACLLQQGSRPSIWSHSDLSTGVFVNYSPRHLLFFREFWGGKEQNEVSHQFCLHSTTSKKKPLQMWNEFPLRSQTLIINKVITEIRNIKLLIILKRKTIEATVKVKLTYAFFFFLQDFCKDYFSSI